MKRLTLILAMLASGLVAACTKESGPYVDVTGGGFIFNYRLAMAFAGVMVAPLRTLPEKSTIEVSIENPAGGPPVMMHQSPPYRGAIEFTTDPLTGIVAEKEYLVTIRLVAANGAELQRIDKKFHSQLDQSILPPAALTVGPGYAENPALAPAAPPPQ